ncbi:MAG: GDP-mannose 4,6-dehydratase [Candidatus Omnitrophica bacterium]|nr:GDP-mannose 4,6-dehydratase [Candidatus Omnitrophota bacterium]MDD5435946.1 GDP-mannose 4,6-dehydratase [Candidatus Omnitrophota bacterium]
MKMKPMKNLITGGAGFIGSHLAERLLENGEKVTVIDNLSTGSIKNIEHLKRDPKFSYHIDTIMNRNTMRRLIKESDMVYHLAAAVGVQYIIDNPLESIKTNVEGTEIVLELAHSLGNKKVVVASTSEIYGKDRPGKRIFKEDDDRVLGATTISRWSYSCTKALDEFLAFAYWREKHLPVVIARFFNTCGSRQTGRYGMVVPRFIKQALSGKPITIYGDGKQSRCFTDVRDTVRALVLLSKNRSAVGEVFNIGNPYNKVTINALAGRIKHMCASGSMIVRIPYEKAFSGGFEDMRHREPDIKKLRSLTGFNPKIKMDEMLYTMIDDIGKGQR